MLRDIYRPKRSLSSMMVSREEYVLLISSTAGVGKLEPMGHGTPVLVWPVS